MDISNIAALNEEDGIVVTLKDFKGDPEDDNGKPLTVTVAGTYSSHYRRAQRQVLNDMQRAIRRGEKPDVEATEDAAYRLEAACILAWDFTAGEKPVTITADNWKAIAQKRPNWREQVQAAMGDHERFFSKS